MAVDNISISITQNSQSTANNTSSITVTGKCRTTGPSMDYNTRTGSVTIDGTKYSFSAKFPENSTITIFTKTVTVKHDDEGKKTVKASFTVTTGMTGTLPGGVISASTSKTLTQIKRTSKVSLSKTSFDIGETITINTNRESTSFTHDAKIVFDGKTVRTQTGIGASYPWNTNELYAIIPGKNTAKGTITLTTYSGSTSIGTSTVDFTATVKNSNPVFSNFEVSDGNAKIVALTGSNQKYVKKYSTATVRVPVNFKMTTKNSATPSHYNVVAGSESRVMNYSSTADTWVDIPSMNTNVINVYAVDSRNNQTPVSKSLSVISYTECVLSSLKVERLDGVGTSVNISLSGTYNPTNFGKVTNSLKSIQIRWKDKKSSTWSSFYSILNLITINTQTGKFSCSEKLFTNPSGHEFTLGTEYDVQVKITDELSTDTENATISSGKVLFSAIKDMGICFGGIFDIALGESNQYDVPMISNSSFNCGSWNAPVKGMITQRTDNSGGQHSVIVGQSSDGKRIYGIDLYDSDTSPQMRLYAGSGYLGISPTSANFNGSAFLKASDVVNNLTSSSTTTPLSANQGRILDNKISRVGNVVITATNSNPASVLGGTWTLIDKEFAPTTGASGGFTNNTTNTTSNNCYWSRNGHSIDFELSFVNKVQLADSTLTIGTINLSTLGISRFEHTTRIPAYTDGGNCVVMVSISTEGVVTTVDIIPDPYVSVGQTTVVTFTQAINYTRMNDSACNKFYWRRTA